MHAHNNITSKLEVCIEFEYIAIIFGACGTIFMTKCEAK